MSDIRSSLDSTFTTVDSDLSMLDGPCSLDFNDYIASDLDGADSLDSSDVLTLESKSDARGYILAYRDRCSDEVKVFTAKSNNTNSIQVFIDEAIEFIKRNLGYVEINVRLMTKSKNQADTSRVITVKKEGWQDAQVVYVGLTEKNYPKDFNENSCWQDHKPIEAISELEDLIDGLIILGDLSFDSEALASRCETLDIMPKITIAHVNEWRAPDSYSTSTNQPEESDIPKKCITSMTGNEPMYMVLEDTSSYGGCSYSTTTHAIRYKAIEKLNGTNTNKVDIEPLAKGDGKKLWLWPGHEYLRTQLTVTAASIKNNLSFSDEFFGAFIELSGRNLDFAIRDVAGVSGAYYINFEVKNLGYAEPFLNKPIFSFLSSYYLKGNYDTQNNHNISNAIIDGWVVADRKDRWDGDGDKIKQAFGSTREFISYWLYYFIRHLYFTTYIESRKTMKSYGRFSSHYVHSAALTIDNIRHPTVGALNFFVGTPLFDIYYKIDGVNRTCSISMSDSNEGLVLGDKTFTMIYCREGEPAHIQCLYSFNDVIASLIKSLALSDHVINKGMDRFDILRAIFSVAHVLDNNIVPSFEI